MKCLSCDRILTDRESSRKGVHSKDYVDLCDRCLLTIPDFEYVENPSLSDKQFDDTEVTSEEQQDD